jgi:cell division protein FtsB
VTKRRIAVLVLLFLGWYLIQGGEYSTLDWLELRSERAREKARIEALRGEVDSLRAEAIAVETDPEVQERIARELYGMLRDGEVVYQVLREGER